MSTSELSIERKCMCGQDTLRMIVPATISVSSAAKTHRLYVCSICSKPFSFELTGQQRRPRTGARCYCSPTCRAEGKRSDNLASWHRNKSRWRAGKHLSDHRSAKRDQSVEKEYDKAKSDRVKELVEDIRILAQEQCRHLKDKAAKFSLDQMEQQS